jgi:hypothetical protein
MEYWNNGVKETTAGNSAWLNSTQHSIIPTFQKILSGAAEFWILTPIPLPYAPCSMLTRLNHRVRKVHREKNTFLMKLPTMLSGLSYIEMVKRVNRQRFLGHSNSDIISYSNKLA